MTNVRRYYRVAAAMVHREGVDSGQTCALGASADDMEGSPHSSPVEGFAGLDRYLARCVRACLRSKAPPDWPSALEVEAGVAASRVKFHGIALLLAENGAIGDDWPAALADEVRDEARKQSFWEGSHRPAIANLLETFHEASIDAVLTKGTALAYSVYPQPALRRRGDSDIVVLSGSRKEVREAMKRCGFKPCGDARPLQESWQIASPPNFVHQVDLHWRINASAAIARRLEGIGPFERAISLPRLSPNARGLALADNLLLTCINRTAHGLLGYLHGREKRFESDRLIWAVDIHLVAQSLNSDDWKALAARAIESGTASSLASGLIFAKNACGTAIPEGVMDRLAKSQADDITALLQPQSRERFGRDFRASATLADKARLLRYTAFPSPQFLRDKYPGAAHWPTPVLAARRIVAGVGKLLRVRS